MIEQGKKIDIKSLLLTEPNRSTFRPSFDLETQLTRRHRKWINDGVGISLYYLEDEPSHAKKELSCIAPITFAFSKLIKIPARYMHSWDVASAQIRELIDSPYTEPVDKVIYMGSAKLLFPEVFAGFKDSLLSRFEDIKDTLAEYQRNVVIPSPEFDPVTFASILFPERQGEFIKTYYVGGNKGMYIGCQIEFEEVYGQHSRPEVPEAQLIKAAEDLVVQASHLRIISPEAFDSEPIPESVWNKLKDVLFQVSDHTSFPMIAAGMAIIAADKIKISEHGVELTHAKISKLDTDKTKLPQWRRF